MNPAGSRYEPASRDARESPSHGDGESEKHDEEPLEQRYHLKTVSCKTCHADSKDRTIYNKFGQMFVEAFKGKGIAEKYEQAKAEGEQQKKEYEAEMAREFAATLLVVEKKTMTIADLIKAGLLNGTRLDQKK